MSGLFPLALYLIDFLDNSRRGVPADSLWMCHLANLLMGLGVLVRRPVITRVGVIWSLAGTLFWVRELFLDPSIGPASYVSHLGGLAFAFYWFRKAKAEEFEGNAWLPAWLFFLGVRLLSGFVTPTDLNVNASQLMRDGFEDVFSAFWQYWVFSSLAALVFLVPIDVALTRLKVSNKNS